MQYMPHVAKPLRTGSVAAFLAVLSISALANGTEYFQFLGSNVAIGENVTFSYLGNSEQTLAGRYKGKFSATTNFSNSPAFNVFCVDLTHNINWNDVYTSLAALGKTTDALQTYNSGTGFYENANGIAGGLSSAMTASDYKPLHLNVNALNPFDTVAERMSGAAYLGRQYLAASLTNHQAAAIQLALWDIIQDGGNGIGIGDFKVTSGFSASDVAGYIAIAASHNHWSNSSDSTDYIQSQRTDPSHINSHKQEFMYAQPVPEPMFYQLGALLGMGGLGMYRMRLRRKA